MIIYNYEKKQLIIPSGLGQTNASGYDVQKAYREGYKDRDNLMIKTPQTINKNGSYTWQYGVKEVNVAVHSGDAGADIDYSRVGDTYLPSPYTPAPAYDFSLVGECLVDGKIAGLRSEDSIWFNFTINSLGEKVRGGLWDESLDALCYESDQFKAGNKYPIFFDMDKSLDTVGGFEGGDWYAVTLPEWVESIADDMFKNNHIELIVSYAQTAPALGNDVFAGNSDSGVLRVPVDAEGYDAWLDVLGEGWTIEKVLPKKPYTSSGDSFETKELMGVFMLFMQDYSIFVKAKALYDGHITLSIRDNHPDFITDVYSTDMLLGPEYEVELKKEYDAYGRGTISIEGDFIKAGHYYTFDVRVKNAKNIPEGAFLNSNIKEVLMMMDGVEIYGFDENVEKVYCVGDPQSFKIGPKAFFGGNTHTKVYTINGADVTNENSKVEVIYLGQ